MDNIKDLDNLMDNFDLHTFWKKKRLLAIFGGYLAYCAVGAIILIKAVLDSSDAGATPKGITLDEPGGTNFIR